MVIWGRLQNLIDALEEIIKVRPRLTDAVI